MKTLQIEARKTWLFNVIAVLAMLMAVTVVANDGTDDSNMATVTIGVGTTPPPSNCTGITNLTAEWRTNGNGLLRVSATGVKDGPIVLSNAYYSPQVIDTKNGNGGKANFNVNGRKLNPIPCRIQVEQAGAGLCGQADVVNAPANCAPAAQTQPLTARGDVYATPVGNPITVTASRLSGVLYNDFGGLPPLTAQLVSGPTAGTLTVPLSADGSFTYTPATPIPGDPTSPGSDNQIDKFTYQVVDAYGTTSAPATVVLQTLSKQVDYKITMNYELGMHCTGFEFSYCCVLPPYNSILAQVIKPAVGNPAPASDPTFTRFVDGYPRLLDGDPVTGADVLDRPTVLREPVLDASNNFKKYQLRYYHDAQPRQEGNTGKPNTSTLISAVEGNSMEYFNTVFDSAAPDPTTNALVYGPYNNWQNVLQGNGTITPNYPVSAGPGGTTTDNYANAWLNHFYIYVDPLNPTPVGPNLEGHGATGLEGDKIRLGVAGQVAYPPDSGAALQPMGPTGNGLPFENVLTFSGDTGTVVFTQMKVLEDLPVMLTSPRIWEALGLPLTPFEDTIGFFADPGAVDEDVIRPYVAMKASLHEYPSGAEVIGSNGQPVIGFGTAPIDIPNCERCHSSPSVDPATGQPNINSPNYQGAGDTFPHAGPFFGIGLEDMTNLEINFWMAYYDIIPGMDSTWYPRLKGAAINMLVLHDIDNNTEFTKNYAGVECTNNPDPTDPAIDPNSYACSYQPLNPDGSPNLADLNNQTDIPQNTRLGGESVICQRCHADNVIANVKSATFDADGNFPIKPITEAIHRRHRNTDEDGGSIVFNDSLGRDGGCQGCHPAHRSDGVMDNYPITLGGNNVNANGDNRLNPGGCFVGRDVHSNPLKDVDGAETASHLNAVGSWLLTNVAQDQGDWRGIWCTNCHSQLGQELWRTEDCDNLITAKCVFNPRAAGPNLSDVVAAINTGRAALTPPLPPLSQQEAIDFLDPKVNGFDRTTDQTHAIWSPVITDAGVATIEVNSSGPVGTRDPDGDFSVNILSFCTTPDCVSLINANKTDQSLWRYAANEFICPTASTPGCTEASSAYPVPFNAATDGRDHWLSAGEPHCADCHAAPYVEQSGNISDYPPFNYPAKASLMRYTRGHQDVSCQGCHESIHGLYPVSPTIDTTSYAQAAALNNDGSHGPVKCAACHTHVTAEQIPTWVRAPDPNTGAPGLVYTDPTGADSGPVSGNYDRAVGWMHTYTEETNPIPDVCANCHASMNPNIDSNRYLRHSMYSRVSRGAMDAAERAVNNDEVFGAASAAQLNQLCTNCHQFGNYFPPGSCTTGWKQHLIEGRVSQSVWEQVSEPLGGCGW